jgi:hypothetical protein
MNSGPEIVYTHERISTALDLAIELLFDHPQLSPHLDTRDRDLLTLAANATQAALVNPATTLEQVIDACYDRGPEEVLSWLRR